jgi:hypothetical protein
VDLPMPGSPATSSTAPGMRPPPSARSSSGMFVERRSFWSERILVMEMGLDALPPPEMGGALDAAPPPVTEASSTKLPQAPQFLHLPSQRGKFAPHSEQTNVTVDLGMMINQNKGFHVTTI